MRTGWLRTSATRGRAGGVCLAVLAVAVLSLWTAGCATTGDEGGDGMTDGTTVTWEMLDYPEARRGDVVDVHHGTRVPDPYRWLEDPDSDETRAWIEAQDAITRPWLDAVPERDAIAERLTELWDYGKYGIPQKHGDRYFFTHNDGLQPQSVLYVTDSLDDEPRVLLDPNTLSEDGTTALSSWSPSEDGRLLAYAISESGSDWLTWRVRDVVSGEDRPDVLRWSKFSGAAWTHDGEGFFYSRYDAPEEGEEFQQANYDQKLMYHRIGDDQADDELVYERPDHPDWGFGAGVTDDGRWLTIHVWKGAWPKNQLFVKDLDDPDAEVIEMLSGWDHSFELAGNEGSIFWLRTDADAPRGRLVAVDVNGSDPDLWREVIPEGDDTLQDANLVGGRFLCRYLSDASSRVRAFTKDGVPAGDVELPGIGTAWGFGGRQDDTETFFLFTGYTTPGTILRLDVAGLQTRVWRAPETAFDPTDYVTEQVFARSADGTGVPIFITRRKDLEVDGDEPTYLYGYGGFNVDMTPGFSISALQWMEMGGVYAVAVLRGGGEYGEEWHQAGAGHNKQNVFDDFIAAGEWLVDNGWTNPDRLAIAGGSNGGLLVAACMNQRPDLWGAVICSVGVLDMLRYHEFTIGWAWTDEYGSAEDPEEFETIFAYSPLHNIREGEEYPPLLITTADHDDRVVPAHSFKFAAAIQAADTGAAPKLIRIETKAGHGAGKPTQKVIAEVADRWAFLVRALDMDPDIRGGD